MRRRLMRFANLGWYLALVAYCARFRRRARKR
jgi:hypothetical protein